jgi:hypothetical protein
MTERMGITFYSVIGLPEKYNAIAYSPLGMKTAKALRALLAHSEAYSPTGMKTA